ncbi:PP2C family serine/threonine-protein phosphatase [Paenibacillus sp. FSL K6-1230]|uniref:PP2C family protein-serine/threonine phosphatase n=1 Tax=Paenibacillus sp. FSL K6-1230 TaxID=2921603 RepID=UPI00039B9B8E|nr:PP2C family serine/threonine-protein phosphatase [Paenibacillus massiliensis]
MQELQGLSPYTVVLIAGVLILVLLLLRWSIARSRPKQTPPVEESGVQIGNGQTIGSRSEQDDYFASMTTPVGTLALVADGISGMANGRMSSTLAVTTFMKEYAKVTRPEEIITYLDRTAGVVNRNILQQLNGQGGGTTLAVVVLVENKLYYGAVGDSMITIYRNGEFVPVNSKHTAEVLLEEKVLAGQMTAEEAKDSPVRYHLINYLGYEGFSSMEIADTPLELLPGDHVLVCSDGIHEALTEIELETIMRKGLPPQDSAEQIIEAVHRKGLKHQDNATVILLSGG